MNAFSKISFMLLTTVSLGVLASSTGSEGDGESSKTPSSPVVRRSTSSTVRVMHSQDALAAIKEDLRLYTISSIASKSKQISLEDRVCLLQGRFSNMAYRNVFNAVLFEKSQKIAKAYAKQSARKLREEFGFALSQYEDALAPHKIRELQQSDRGEMVEILKNMYKGPKSIMQEQHASVNTDEWYREVRSQPTTATPKASPEKDKRQFLTSASRLRQPMLPPARSVPSEQELKRKEPQKPWR